MGRISDIGVDGKGKRQDIFVVSYGAAVYV